MITEDFLQQYWRFFMTLEQDLLATERYVAFDQQNEKTYSVEYNRLYQATCSEVDVLAKELCRLLGDKQSYKINMYFVPIAKAFPCVLNEKVVASGLGDLYPWTGWTSEKGPEWWQQYNAIKHHRTEKCTNKQSEWHEKFYYQCATLKNVMQAMAGLYVLEFYTLLLLCQRENDPHTDDSRSSYNKLLPVFKCQTFRLPAWFDCQCFFFGNTFVDRKVIEQLLVERRALSE